MTTKTFHSPDCQEQQTSRSWVSESKTFNSAPRHLSWFVSRLTKSHSIQLDSQGPVRISCSTARSQQPPVADRVWTSTATWTCGFLTAFRPTSFHQGRRKWLSASTAALKRRACSVPHRLTMVLFRCCSRTIVGPLRTCALRSGSLPIRLKSIR